MHCRKEHHLPVPVAVTPVAAIAATAGARLDALGDVRQQGHLAGPLHRLGDLHLVTPARAGDAAAADLPLLGDVPAQPVDVLVVDVRDLVLAEEAIAPLDLACRPAGTLPLLCSLSWHVLS